MSSKHTHFSKAIMALSGKYDTAVARLAKRAGICRSTLSRTLQGARPHSNTLKGMCSQMVEPIDGTDLLLAHLHDEVKRAGNVSMELELMITNYRISEKVRVLVIAPEESRALLKTIDPKIKLRARKLN